MELGPQAQSLLKAAREGDEPSREAQARVRAALAAKLALGAAATAQATATIMSVKSAGVATAGGTSTGALGGAAAVPLGFIAKVTVSLAIASTVGLGAATFVRANHPAAAASSAIVASALPARASTAAAHSAPALFVPAQPAAASRELPETHAADRMPAPQTAVAHRQSVERPAGVAHEPPARMPSAQSEVEVEVLLLGKAHAALQAGDASHALALLDEHSRRFPDGVLGEEREVSRVAALCALGRKDQAQAATARFLQAFPRSPHMARVLASCGAAAAQTF